MDENYDASDTDSVDRQRDLIKNEYETLMSDYRKILKTNEGHRFFKHFFKIGKLTDISMTGNSWTFFHEGHRNFTKIVYNEVCQADAEAAAKILAEIIKEASKELEKHE